MNRSFVTVRRALVMAVGASLLIVAVAQQAPDQAGAPGPASAPAAATLDDQPAGAPAETGRITGTITPADRIQSISLLAATDAESVTPAEYDAATGEFTFGGLLGDTTYALAIQTTDGRTFQGVDLSFVDAGLLRMAAQRRQEEALPPTETRPFTSADADTLTDLVADMRGFMGVRRVLYLQGHGARATMLVELVQAGPTQDSGSDVAWRVELWYFQNADGVWLAVPGQARVVRRFRGPLEQWRQLAVEFRPELSVYVDPQGLAQPVTFQIPEGIAPSRGRPPGTSPQLTTDPNVSGIDGPPPTPEDLPDLPEGDGVPPIPPPPARD